MTIKFFHILFNVLIYFLLSISLGIEGGYNLPAVGFNNLNSGPVLAAFVNRDIGFADITLSLETNFYRGKNPGYSLNLNGIRFGLSKNHWRLSPVIELGIDYVSRSINKTKESGFSLLYGIGFLINFKSDRLRIYPKFYYDGFTDFKSNAGVIGMKLGIAYEM